MKFTIKAGKHYANNFHRLRLLFKRSIEFKFRISHSALYDPGAVVNGWSKIIGIAEPFGHRNSCRLVFGCFEKDVLTIGMYCYVGGVSPQDNTAQKQVIAAYIQPDTWYHGIIAHHHYQKNHCYYTAVWGNGLLKTLDMPCKKYWFGIRFLLHPYIGGRFTLDNDCYIDIERL